MSAIVTRTLGAACVVLILVACAPAPSRHQHSVLVFGTVVDITLYAPRALAQQAFAELQTRLLAMHRDWHAWEPGALGDINRAIAAGRSARDVPASLRTLIRIGQDLERRSSGRFNPALGRGVHLWGFHESAANGTHTADAQALAELRESRPRMADLHIKGSTVSSSNPAVQLDLGGYAKGFAIAQALQYLDELGIENAMINAGGDLQVRGLAGTRPWRIGIRDPLHTGQIIADLTLNDGEAVMTSGSYERRRDEDNAHHILDPLTVRPTPTWASATVVHNDATLADAAATALMASGREEWQQIAQQMGLQQILLIDPHGQAWASAALAKRLHWRGTTPPQAVELARI